MKWVTTRGIKINRAATAWLIRRFVDPDAEFLFVQRDEVVDTARREQGHGFHAPGTSFPHRDDAGRTPFEALVATYCPDDDALRAMASIVRHADLPGAADSPPESAGLRVISGAFPLVARTDDETVERSQFMYDALYAALQERTRPRRSPPHGE